MLSLFLIIRVRSRCELSIGCLSGSDRGSWSCDASEFKGGPNPLQAALADRGTGLRHHQGRPRIHRLFPARSRQGGGRVGPGGPGLQLQAAAQAQAGDGVVTAFLARRSAPKGRSDSRRAENRPQHRSDTIHSRRPSNPQSRHRQWAGKPFSTKNSNLSSPTDC